MSSGFLSRIRRTVAFRLTLWYSGVFILGALLFFSSAYALLSSSLTTRDEEAVRTRLAELAERYRAGGIDALERDITVTKKFERAAPFFVRLAGADGTTRYLIIPYQWSEFDMRELENAPGGEGVRWMRVRAKDSRTVLEVAAMGVGRDSVLQVGKSNEDRVTVLRYFRDIFAAVMIPAVLFGFVGGIFLSFRALRPVRHLVTAIRSIDTGRMDARVPVPGTGDELDELVTLFNTMVEKIETLILGMKGSLDNVAHDLRTPMTRLRGAAEMALQSGEGEAVCRETLADCIEESDKILRMLDAVMDISEAETGTIALALEPVNLASALRDVVELYRYVSEDKGVAIEAALDDTLTIRADPTRVRQVFANLLDNAVKYTPAGGTVTVEAKRSGGEVAIVVTDTGAGIAPEDLPRIWDRLYRGDRSRSEKGLGLGLSLVKAIVEAHIGTRGGDERAGPGGDVYGRHAFRGAGVDIRSQGPGYRGDYHRAAPCASCERHVFFPRPFVSLSRATESTEKKIVLLLVLL